MYIRFLNLNICKFLYMYYHIINTSHWIMNVKFICQRLDCAEYVTLFQSCVINQAN